MKHYLFLINLDATLLTLLGAIFGGALLKLAEYFVTRGKAKVDEATAIRAELRVAIKDLTTEKEGVEAQRDTWRERYYSQLEKYSEQTATLRWALQRLEHCREQVPSAFKEQLDSLLEGRDIAEEMTILEGALKAQSQLAKLKIGEDSVIAKEKENK